MQLFFMTAWAKFVEFMHGVPLINYGFGQNEGIWIHIIGASILAKIIRIRFSYIATIIIVFFIAVLWEIIEIYIETPTMTAVLSIYGTYARYLYDTAGDIIGAVVIAIIANFPTNSRSK